MDTQNTMSLFGTSVPMKDPNASVEWPGPIRKTTKSRVTKQKASTNSTNGPRARRSTPAQRAKLSRCLQAAYYKRELKKRTTSLKTSLTSVSGLANLPSEVIYMILSHLPILDLTAMACTSRRINTMAYSEHYYRGLYTTVPRLPRLLATHVPASQLFEILSMPKTCASCREPTSRILLPLFIPICPTCRPLVDRLAPEYLHDLGAELLWRLGNRGYSTIEDWLAAQGNGYLKVGWSVLHCYDKPGDENEMLKKLWRLMGDESGRVGMVDISVEPPAVERRTALELPSRAPWEEEREHQLVGWLTMVGEAGGLLTRLDAAAVRSRMEPQDDPRRFEILTWEGLSRT